MLSLLHPCALPLLIISVSVCSPVVSADQSVRVFAVAGPSAGSRCALWGCQSSAFSHPESTNTNKQASEQTNKCPLPTPRSLLSVYFSIAWVEADTSSFPFRPCTLPRITLSTCWGRREREWVRVHGCLLWRSRSCVQVCVGLLLRVFMRSTFKQPWLSASDGPSFVIIVSLGPLSYEKNLFRNLNYT